MLNFPHFQRIYYLILCMILSFFVNETWTHTVFIRVLQYSIKLKLSILIYDVWSPQGCITTIYVWCVNPEVSCKVSKSTDSFGRVAVCLLDKWKRRDVITAEHSSTQNATVSGINGISFVEIENKIPETPWQQKFGEENAPKITSGGDKLSAHHLSHLSENSYTVCCITWRNTSRTQNMLQSKLSMWCYATNSF